MHRTQTCTMAEFVWLHIHLDNLQLRLFIQNIRSHTSHIHTNTHPHTYTRTLTYAYTRSYAHTHTREAQINNTINKHKSKPKNACKLFIVSSTTSLSIPLCNFSLTVKILFHFLLNRPNPYLVLYFLNSILITPLLTHSFLTYLISAPPTDNSIQNKSQMFNIKMKYKDLVI